MKNNLNKQTINNFEKLVQIVKILRSEKGCDWDRIQTNSLMPYFIEEVYELVDSIDKKDYNNTKEELGDVMLHLVFQAQILNEKGGFIRLMIYLKILIENWWIDILMCLKRHL